MFVVFPRPSLTSPCLVTVVQHTSTSTKFTNNTWRYVEVYRGVTEVLHRARVDNILTEGT